MKGYIRSLDILDTKELDFIDNHVVKKSFRKDEFLLRTNSICKELYFVRSGALRSFSVDNNGDEITHCIAFDNEFMCDFHSFISQQPSRQTIHALLGSDVEVIKYEDLEKLYDSCIGWQKVGRKIIEQQYISMEQHFIMFQQDDSSGRYEYLLKNYRRQLSLIPQHYIASYLGISTRQLTRIRKSLL